MQCFECEVGTYKEVIKDFVCFDGFVAKEIPTLVCGVCDDECLSAKASYMIEEARRAAGIPEKIRPRRKKYPPLFEKDKFGIEQYLFDF